MNKILSIIKQIPKSTNKSCSSTFISTFIKNENSLYLRITKNNQLNNSSLQLQDNQNDLLTLENFPYSHLCNRDIRHLPLSKENSNDIDRLRSCYILTMTDLIGRYLIHKTSDEFREFLIKKVQCSQSFTNEIIQLMNIWTLYNLQIGRGTRTTTFKQYI